LPSRCAAKCRRSRASRCSKVEGIVKDSVHQQIEDALRDVISCAVEAIIDVQQDMIETPHEPRRR